jgi:hypothetical protein
MNTAGNNSVSSFSFAGIAAAFSLAWAVSLAPAMAQGTPEQRQACQGDAMRLCSEFVPDVERITACMVKKRIRLSPGCRVLFQVPRKAKSFKRNS